MSEFVDFVRNQYTTLPIPQAPDNIKDGIYVVTGANTGLGFECAKHLVRAGAANVILGVRSVTKGEAALTAIRNDTGRKDVGEVWELDLASLGSVETFAARLNKLNRVDGIIANAGVVMGHFQLSEGIETSLLVNVVSTMLLAFRSLPKLRESGKVFNIQPRLVIVTSNSATESARKSTVENIDGDIFAGLSTEVGFKVMQQYPKTKLLEIYAVREFAKLFPVSETGVVINMVNPGLCYSSLDRNGAFHLRLLLAVMRLLLARTTEQGSRTLLHAVFAGSDSHGKYCSECAVKDAALPTWITNEAGRRTQKRVWDDILKRLDISGHSVDIAGLRVGTGKDM